jgi:hypothetical protein
MTQMDHRLLILIVIFKIQLIKSNQVQQTYTNNFYYGTINSKWMEITKKWLAS